MSLRARLLLALVGLVTCGFLVAGAITYDALRNFLDHRVDQQLPGAMDAVVHALGRGQPSGDDRHGSGDLSFPAGTYGAFFSADGDLLASTTIPAGGTAARPELPRDLLSTVSPGESVITTRRGTGGVDSYRILAAGLPTGAVVVAAIPLTEIQATLTRLLLIEAGVGGAVLLVLAGVAYLLVRLGLRPLDRIGETAGAIAAGDLSRRVDVATPRTEVGRLGIALNAMLSQIEQAFAERQRSESRLRQFVADASHELRTPLTSIRGYAEMFRRGAADRPADLSTAMRRIEQESLRMGGLVEDLLLLAHLDQGRPLAHRPVDLTELVLDASLDARAVAPDRAVGVRAGEPVMVDGDESRLRQAVGNLVGNALAHTPAGTSIELTVSREAEIAKVSVTDHGPGIPPDAAGQVFERFKRLDAGRSRDRGGTGLGLSIVASIVAAHGGTVGVTPTPGGGATFVMTLPLQQRQGQLAPPESVRDEIAEGRAAVG